MSELTRAEDKKWLMELGFQLRLRDADGAAIGDALAQVEAHCVESGESPQAAFGDAADYAAALALPKNPLNAAAVGRVVLAGTAGYLGAGLLLRAALARGAVTVPITTGDVASLLVMVASTGVLLAYVRPLMGVRWRFAVWFAVTFAAIMCSAVWLRTPLVQVGIPVAIALGVIFLTAGLGVLFYKNRTDRVRDPRRA